MSNQPKSRGEKTMDNETERSEAEVRRVTLETLVEVQRTMMAGIDRLEYEVDRVRNPPELRLQAATALLAIHTRIDAIPDLGVKFKILYALTHPGATQNPEAA